MPGLRSPMMSHCHMRVWLWVSPVLFQAPMLYATWAVASRRPPSAFHILHWGFQWLLLCNILLELRTGIIKNNLGYNWLDWWPWAISMSLPRLVTHKTAQNNMATMVLSQVIAGPTHQAEHTLGLVLCAVQGDSDLQVGDIFTVSLSPSE